MKIRRSTRFQLAALSLAGLLLTTGCGTGGSGAGSTSYEGEFNAKAFEGQTVRVLRHSGNDAEVMQKQFEAFTAATGIKVEMDNVPFSNLRTKEVTELSASSSTYDLMSTTDYWLTEYANAGWLEPLDDLIQGGTTADPEFDISDIDESFLTANEVNDQAYALPWKFNTAVLAYRTDVFPTAPKTFDEWIGAKDAAKAAGKDLVGLSLSTANAPELYLDFLVSNGGSFLNDDNTKAAFNSDAGRKSLEQLVSLSKNAAAGAVNRSWEESAELMGAGATASEVVLSSGATKAGSGAASGQVAYTPLVPAATSSNYISTWGLLMPKGSQHKEAAFLLMQYLLSKDVVTQMAEAGGGGVVPARTSVLDKLTAKYPSFAAQKASVANAKSWPKITTLDAARTAMAEPLQNAVLGTATVEEALSKAEEAVNKALGS